MINLRGKEMLFIEAHGHVWQKLHGRRFDTKKLRGIGYGRILIGDEEVQFLPPDNVDSSFTIGVFKTYEKLLGFDKAVLLQTPCYGEQYEYINEIIAKEPERYVTVGLANPQDKKAFLEEASLCLDRYKYKGLKFESPDTPFDMTAPENQFVFETIMDHDAFFMLDLGWGDGPDDFPIDDLLEVAKRYPKMKIMLPHMGVSRFWDPKEAKTLDSLKKTLSIVEYNDTVHFDCSGLPMLFTRAGEEYPWPGIQDVLKTAKTMGVLDRVMWGTDAPTVLLACTYQQHVECITRHSDFLTDEELENLMGKTADKFWFGK